jgi:hypothetical protein
MKMHKFDSITDCIDAYIDFMQDSLSPAYIRLVRHDLRHFFHWYGQFKPTNIAISNVELIAEYRKSLESDQIKKYKSRMLQSAKRFMDWYLTFENSCGATIELGKGKQIGLIVPIYNRSSNKYIIYILFIFFCILFLSAIGLFVFTRKTASKTTKRANHNFNFVIQLPVVSDTLHQSLRSSSFTVMLQDKLRRSLPFSCSVGLIDTNTPMHIFIRSMSDCYLAQQGSEPMIDEESVVASIYFNNEFLKSINLNFVPVQAQMREFGITESQNIANNVVSNNYLGLPNSAANGSVGSIYDDTMFDVKPNSVETLDLMDFDSIDASENSVVSEFYGNLVNSFEDDKVLGVLNDDKIIRIGLAKVRVAFSSAHFVKGDILSLSHIPGAIQKGSLVSNNIIGISMENWSGDDDTVKIYLQSSDDEVNNK